jgi:uncharacterized membrane protein
MTQTPAFFARRLEALSDTVFGISMTLLAYNLPTPASYREAPSWRQFTESMTPHVKALLLSFLVAGLFWLSHQRRLAASGSINRRGIFANFAFLLGVIVLPVTTNLYGTFGAAGDVVPIYGLHLLLLALLNSALWACVLFGPNADRRVQRTAIVAPAFVAFVNAVALMLAFLRSPVAPYLWYLALAGPMVDSRFTRALD